MDCKPLATKQFGIAEQLEFAALSGDHNPMHLDPLAARRTQTGAPVVHGIHALLWSLEELVAAGLIGLELSDIGVQFRKFIYLNVPCGLVVTHRNASAVKAELHSDGLVVATMLMRNGKSGIDTDDASFSLPELVSAGNNPNMPSLSQLPDMSGWTSGPASTAGFERAFPNFAGVIGVERIAAVASLSRLVGMICPGLNSIFAKLDIDLVQPSPRRPGIGFKVTTVNERYRLVAMDVRGSGVAGKVIAFMRWPPVETPPMDIFTKVVAVGEFSGVEALIVGGSRGLGAVTAKIIAAGGGKVVITYVKGRAEADKVASEINAACGSGACLALAYDSACDPSAQLSTITEQVNQLYYFATPPIFRQSSNHFSSRIFHDFCSVYLDGFNDVCRFVRARSGAKVLSVFYPSSVSIEQRPAGLTEYAMAKAAGEILCADMMQHDPGFRILVARLPRTLTDQTATISVVENANPLDVMLPLIRNIAKLQ